jgi:hypothetical protein
MTISTIGAGLLVAGGLINALPPVDNSLSKISGGKPVIKVIIGIVSTIVGLAVIAKLA